MMTRAYNAFFKMGVKAACCSDLFGMATLASGGRVLVLKFQAPDVIGPTSNWRTSAHLHGSTNPSCNRPCQQDLAAVNPHHQCAHIPTMLPADLPDSPIPLQHLRFLPPEPPNNAP